MLTKHLLLVFHAALVFCGPVKCPDFAQRNLNTIQSIYNLTIYPNNLAIIQGGSSAVPSGLFNENATGRITPIGNFSGFADSIEYFFGLAPVPQPPAYGAIYQAELAEFQSACPEVATSTVYLRTANFGNGTTPGQPLYPLKQVSG